MRIENYKDRAVEVMSALLDKLGYIVSPDKEGAVVSAYATGRSVGVTVMWPDDDEEDDGEWVQC